MMKTILTLALVATAHCATPSGGRGGVVGRQLSDVPYTDSQGTSSVYKIDAPADANTKLYGLHIHLHGDGGSGYVTFPNKAPVLDLIGVAVLSNQADRRWGRGAGGPVSANYLNDLIQKELLVKYNVDKERIFFSAVSGGGLFMTGYFIPAFGQNYPNSAALLMCGAMNPQVPFASPNIINSWRLDWQGTNGDRAVTPAAMTASITAYRSVARAANVPEARIAALLSITLETNNPHCNFDGTGFSSGIQTKLNARFPAVVAGVTAGAPTARRAPTATAARPTPIPAPVGEATFVRYPNTFCRGEAGSNAPESYAQVAAADEDDCKAKCVSQVQPLCRGFEFKIVGQSNCELWTAAIAGLALANPGESACTVVARAGGPRPTAAPAPKPTTGAAKPTANARPTAAPGGTTSGLKVTLNFPDNTLPEPQKQAFVTAKNTMECIMKGVQGVANFETVITAVGRNIDGPGKILGSAGPNRITRTPAGKTIPLTGFMQFDLADLATMEQQGTLVGVITHEMMHVMGMGTLWERNGCTSAACETAQPGPQPGAPGAPNAWNSATCPLAFAEYQKFGGTGILPIEDQFGPGTKCGHWKESVFTNEIATGFVANRMPISLMTVQSYADIGYVTDKQCREVDINFRLTARVEQELAGFETGDRPPIEAVEMTEDWWGDRMQGVPMEYVPEAMHLPDFAALPDDDSYYAYFTLSGASTGAPAWMVAIAAITLALWH